MSQVSEKKVLRSRSPRSRSASRSPRRTPSRDLTSTSREQSVGTRKSKRTKTANQLLKEQKLKEFDAMIDYLVKIDKQLDKLGDRKLKPSHRLVFPKKDDEPRFLHIHEITAMKEEKRKVIQNLKKLHREGIKNRRTQMIPTTFRAHFTPIKAGPAIIEFLGSMTINGKKVMPTLGGIPDPKTNTITPKTNLLDVLPRAREGYFLRNSLTLLMIIYSLVNDLKSKAAKEGHQNIPDARMNKVFGEQTALYYQEGKSPKVLMKKSGKDMTTYEVVSNKNESFNANKIENYFFQSILSLNFYKPADLDTNSIKTLSDENVKLELLEEFKTLELVNKILKGKI